MLLTRLETAVAPQQERFQNVFLPALFHLLVWSYAVFAAVCSLAVPVSEFDDAIPLVSGMLVQQGHTPNLDFYSFYPPLSSYVNAAAFHLFGKSVTTVRLMSAFLYSLVLLLATLFFRSQFRSAGPLVPAAVLVLAISIGGLLKLPVWPGFAVSLIALLVYLCSHNLDRRRMLVVVTSGVLTGAALLYRVNFGGYVLAVVLCDLLLQWWFHDKGRLDFFHARADIRTLVAYVIPVVLVSAGFCLWVYGAQIGAAVSEFVVTAQKVMTVRGFIPLQFSESIAYPLVFPCAWFFLRMLKEADGLTIRALCAAVLALAILALALAGRNHLRVALIAVALEIAAVLFLHLFVYRLNRAELSMLLFSCCLLHYFLSRAEWFHWRLLPAGWALFLPFIAVPGGDPDPAVSSRPVHGRGTVLAVLAAAAFMLIASPGMRPGTPFRNGFGVLTTLMQRPRIADTEVVLGGTPVPLGWDSLFPDTNELKAVRYLRERTSSTSPIFVGVEDHSRVFLNHVRTYWLADRPIGVHLFQLETRMATEEPVQREIILDLEKNPVSWMILDRTPFRGEETLNPYQGSRLLDEHIANHFREETRFGRYAVLRRTY